LNFREFATNYLNPIFLFYRATLIMFSGGMLFLSMPMFMREASQFEFFMPYLVGLGVAAALITKVKGRPYSLYLILPVILIFIAISLHQNEFSGVLFAPLITFLIAAYLILWNGIRSWGYGISINDIRERMDNQG